jgi:hypothetical protein
MWAGQKYKWLKNFWENSKVSNFLKTHLAAFRQTSIQTENLIKFAHIHKCN